MRLALSERVAARELKPIPTEERRAFEALKNKIEASDWDAVSVPSVRGVNPWHAVKIVLRATAAARMYEGELEVLSPIYDVRLPRLRKLALALRHVERLVEKPPVRPDMDEARALRRRLSRAVAPLVDAGLIKKEDIDFGPIPTGDDVLRHILGMVEVLAQHWPKVESSTALTRRDLHAAIELAESFNVPPAKKVPFRRILMHMLDEEYKELRWAIQYIRRRHGDANDIAPTLRKGGPRRRGSASEVAKSSEPEAAGMEDTAAA